MKEKLITNKKIQVFIISFFIYITLCFQNILVPYNILCNKLKGLQVLNSKTKQLKVVIIAVNVEVSILLNTNISDEIVQQAVDVNGVLESPQFEECLFLNQYKSYYTSNCGA